MEPGKPTDHNNKTTRARTISDAELSRRLDIPLDVLGASECKGQATVKMIALFVLGRIYCIELGPGVLQTLGLAAIRTWTFFGPKARAR